LEDESWKEVLKSSQLTLHKKKEQKSGNVREKEERFGERVSRKKEREVVCDGERQGRMAGGVTYKG
jgi:hypothetical protein